MVGLKRRTVQQVDDDIRALITQRETAFRDGHDEIVEQCTALLNRRLEERHELRTAATPATR